jgi:hypothetical protein
MSKKLTVGNESFDYPITGTNNYGEGATDWSEAITDAVAEFFGPGDIRTTEAALANNTTADVSGLVFDTAYVQRVKVEGIITRKFNSNPTKTESFMIEGSYNTSEFNITVEFSGDDTEVELFMNGGQVRYTSADVADTSEMTIKFKASTIISEEDL